MSTLVALTIIEIMHSKCEFFFSSYCFSLLSNKSSIYIYILKLLKNYIFKLSLGEYLVFNAKCVSVAGRIRA